MPSNHEPGRSPHVRPPVPGGWMLVEWTIAASFLLIGLVAVVPLFLRAARDVARGAAESRAAGLGLDRLEGLAGPIAEAITLPPEFFGLESRTWSSTPPAPPDRALWVREGTVGFLELGALEDGRIDPTESSKVASPDATLVLVEVEVRGSSSGEVRTRLARLERASR